MCARARSAGLVVAVIGSAPAASARAQSATVSIELPVVLVARLTVDNTVIDLGSPRQTDYGTAGKTLTTPVSITAKTNAKYAVTMKAGGTSFLYTKPATGFNPTTTPTKSAGDLRFSTTAGATCSASASWTPVSTAGATVLGVASGNGTGSKNGASGDNTKLCFNTVWTYGTDVPGNYSIDLLFTLSAP